MTQIAICFLFGLTGHWILGLIFMALCILVELS